MIRTKRTELIVDGSKHGVGAILAQEDIEKAKFQPIRFDSRATTAAEKNYSQIELESLALVFRTLKNHLYLYGLPHYTAVTDHKPLLPLYSTSKVEMPARILRHKLKIQGYNFDLKHVPGKDNPTDCISRSPIGNALNSTAVGATPLQLAVNAVIRTDLPNAVSTDTLIQHTHLDPTLACLSSAIKRGYIGEKDYNLRPYKQVFSELSVDDSGLILRGERIVIPKTLQ